MTRRSKEWETSKNEDEEEPRDELTFYELNIKP